VKLTYSCADKALQQAIAVYALAAAGQKKNAIAVAHVAHANEAIAVRSEQPKSRKSGKKRKLNI
jgi:hypothetical protein